MRYGRHARVKAEAEGAGEKQMSLLLFSFLRENEGAMTNDDTSFMSRFILFSSRSASCLGVFFLSLARNIHVSAIRLAVSDANENISGIRFCLKNTGLVDVKETL